MSFRSEERALQLKWKNSTASLSELAKKPGLYTGRDAEQSGTKPDDMFLNESAAHENLLPAIRLPALSLFTRHDIDWHDAGDMRGPSNFLMDSMVSCVNCLFPFAFDGVALAKLFRPVVPDAVGAIEVEDGLFLTHEWLGAENYLDEKSPGRKRGAKGTSIDAFCVLVRANGERVGLLVEWKYFERNRPGRKHGEHYAPLLAAADSPVAIDRCGGAAALFHEPYYQLARQALLASKMESVREAGAARFVNVLIAPSGNTEYLRDGCSPELERAHPGMGAVEAFRALLKEPDRFFVTSFQRLAAQAAVEPGSALGDAFKEACARYCEGRNG